MFGSSLKAVWRFSIFIAFGCAQPKYVNADQSGTPQLAGKENKALCQNQFQNSGYCLDWSWENKPTSSEMGSFVFKVYHLNAFDQTPIEVDLASAPQVVLWMPAMGHGSSPTKVDRLDTGTYRVSNVFFVMPGEWEMKFQVKDGASVLDEAIIQFTF